MKLILFLLLLPLAGCSTILPVKQSWPDIPPALEHNCQDLIQIPEDTKEFSDVLVIVSDNYLLYSECQIKVNGWLDWYKKQKELFSSQ